MMLKMVRATAVLLRTKSNTWDHMRDFPGPSMFNVDVSSCHQRTQAAATKGIVQCTAVKKVKAGPPQDSDR